MTHRMAVEEFLFRKNLSRVEDKGPRLSQNELDEQVKRFFAAGGKIQEIPSGMSGEAFNAKRTQQIGQPRLWSRFTIKAES